MRLRSVVLSSAAFLFASAIHPSTLAAQNTPLTVQQYKEQLHEDWRHTMHQTPAPQEGCYHASYPSTEWQKVDCAAPPAYRSAHTNTRTQDLGNAYDYVAQAPSGTTFSAATGSVVSTSSLKSEKDVNVPFGGGESTGVTGPNEYSLQINTNFANTAACAGYKSCRAWQQYVITTNTFSSLTSNKLTGDTEVFIEYWLINYGGSTSASCPSGFLFDRKDTAGVDCVQNSPATVIYDGQLPITDLPSLQLSATAIANGTDKATATYDTEAYTATIADSYTDIASGWTQAEFNVLGNVGGSRADFNKDASLTLKIALTDGSTTAPSCIAPSSDYGTTGETNNLNAESCTTSGGSTPYIEFTETE